jgi:hypothetical protein
MIEGPGKSSSPLEARRMVLGGDGAYPATTAGLVMVYTRVVASSKGGDRVVAMLEALKNSVVAVWVKFVKLGKSAVTATKPRAWRP